MHRSAARRARLHPRHPPLDRRAESIGLRRVACSAGPCKMRTRHRQAASESASSRRVVPPDAVAHGGLCRDRAIGWLGGPCLRARFGPGRGAAGCAARGRALRRARGRRRRAGHTCRRAGSSGETRSRGGRRRGAADSPSAWATRAPCSRVAAALGRTAGLGRRRSAVPARSAGVPFGHDRRRSWAADGGRAAPLPSLGPTSGGRGGRPGDARAAAQAPTAFTIALPASIECTDRRRLRASRRWIPYRPRLHRPGRRPGGRRGVRVRRFRRLGSRRVRQSRHPASPLRDDELVRAPGDDQRPSRHLHLRSRCDRHGRLDRSVYRTAPALRAPPARGGGEPAKRSALAATQFDRRGRAPSQGRKPPIRDVRSLAATPVTLRRATIRRPKRSRGRAAARRPPRR
jgi:hypothetical protein